MRRRRLEAISNNSNNHMTNPYWRNRPSSSSFRFRSIIVLTLILISVSWVCLLLNVQRRRTTTIHQDDIVKGQATTNLRSRQSNNQQKQQEQHDSQMKQSSSSTINHPPDNINNDKAHDDSASKPPPPPPRRRWFWIGIVRDAQQVQESTWDTLALVACSNQVHIHIVVGQNAAVAVDQLLHQRVQKQPKLCAPVYIETEHDVGIDPNALPSNRVDRIALIRDVQRQRLRQLWLQDRTSAGLAQDVVVVADLDLFRLPPVERVLEQAGSMATSSDDNLDVVCAAGVTMASRQELWYYDTYATVLLPDTYVHPLKRRLVKEYFKGENHSLVRSDNQHGSFTQGDLMRYLQQQATDTGTVLVRSCFGGLSIYRATTFFEPKCSYTRQQGDEKRLERYASESDGRPCEHVVFQTCLQDHADIASPAKIAINPNLLLLWRKN